MMVRDGAAGGGRVELPLAGATTSERERATRERDPASVAPVHRCEEDEVASCEDC
jgi:hypothetical protein